jgi:hypothetical protein
MKKQRKIIIASFIYFVIVIENNNGEIPPKLKQAYFKVKNIVQGNITGNLSDNSLLQVMEVQKELNKILANIDYNIDYLLASVTILAEYYEQLKGKKKYFYPMSHKEILALQDKLLEDSTAASETFEFCEFLVKELLK